MTNILQDISFYSLKDHLPFPTLDYIRQETGFDLFRESGSEERANALIRTYTKTAWNTLRAIKTQDTANKLEYLIATNKEYRYAFLEYVATFVSAVYHLGGIDFLQASENADTSKSLPLMVRNYLEGSLLKVERLAIIYEYRVGY